MAKKRKFSTETKERMKKSAKARFRRQFVEEQAQSSNEENISYSGDSSPNQL